MGSPLQNSSPVQWKRQPPEGDLFVIHGGSDNTKVLGDMWWFDLDTESWTEVTTYGKDQERGMTPIKVCIVGQSMVTVGDINVSLGGLNQEEIDRLYLGKDEPKDIARHQQQIGNDFLTIFDLNTQCLQGHNVKRIGEGKDSRLVLADDESNNSGFNDGSYHGLNVTGLVTSFGCQVLHTNGTLTLVGGLVAKRLELDCIGFRGAVLESVLPSISLAS